MVNRVYPPTPSRRNRKRLRTAVERYRAAEFVADQHPTRQMADAVADAAELVLHDTAPRPPMTDWEQIEKEESSSTSTPTPDERCSRSS